MSILLFGGAGVLGSQLQERLDVFAPTKKGFDIINPNVKKLDRWLRSFDTVINCAVSREADKLNHIYHINTAFPTYLADIISKRRKKCRFIQISTDRVFDGIQGKGNQPYSEMLPMLPPLQLSSDLTCSPEYSFTKLQAENNVLLFNGYIIRTSFYPLTLIEEAPTNKLTSAMYVDDIAKKIAHVVDNIEIWEKRVFLNILHIGSPKPRVAFDVVKERNPDVKSFQLEQGMDFSLNTTIYHKLFGEEI